MSGPLLSPASVDFLARLRAENNREWFREHRGELEELVLAPARELVWQVGERLRKKVPNLIADPRVDRSIYRFNRDVRFSRDKSPYKSHLALWWWEGVGERVESPGFYFQLSPDGWFWSTGLYRFAAEALERYRAAVLDPKKGAAFLKIAEGLKKNGVALKAPDVKRVPNGFDSSHPMAYWLRFKGFYTWAGEEERGFPPELFSDAAADFLVGHFRPTLKLHQWLVDVCR